MQTRNKSPWRSILLLLLSGIASIISLSTGFVMFFSGLFEISGQDEFTAASTLTLAGGLIILGIILLPAVYYSFMHILEKPAKPIPLNRIPTSLLIAVWVISATMAITLEKTTPSPFILIPFNLATVILPVWILLRIGLRGLNAGSPERLWGTFTVGVTIVPLIIGILETILLLVAGITALIGILLNPESLRTIENLSTRLIYTSDPDTILKILSPYLANPSLIVLGLIFISIFVPIIEETIKPLGVWLDPKRILSPRQGFAVGIICGAAYALVESLGVTPGIPASSNMLGVVRAGTDLLHVVTSGLMGWALVYAWKERKFLQLGLTFLLVVTIHGLWNAFALASASELALNSVSQPSLLLKSLPTLSITGLTIITVMNLYLLYYSNRKMQSEIVK